METELHDITQFYHKIYYSDCPEFEEVRELCLQEDNWLRHIYTKDRLSVSRHHGFAVIYDKRTNEPASFGGVFRDERIMPRNIARMLNRTYWFPKYRISSLRGVNKLWKLAVEHGVKPLIEINNFDGYFMAMQDRRKKTTGYFDIWVKGLQNVDSKWVKGDGYLQTCPSNVRNCWQYYVYLDVKQKTFESWNPKIINNTEWESLSEGIDQ